jgi:hypothetical protein
VDDLPRQTLLANPRHHPKNEDDDNVDHWLDVLPADTRAAILDSGEGDDESTPIVQTPPAPDEEPEPAPEPDLEPEPEPAPEPEPEPDA